MTFDAIRHFIVLRQSSRKVRIVQAGSHHKSQDAADTGAPKMLHTSAGPCRHADPYQGRKKHRSVQFVCFFYNLFINDFIELLVHRTMFVLRLSVTDDHTHQSVIVVVQERRVNFESYNRTE